MIGIDYGSKRIGIAVCDPLGMIATPLKTIVVSSPQEAATESNCVAVEENAEGIVVGFPLNMDGTIGPAAQAVERFCDLLRAKTELPIATWDERLTTAQVERVLIEADTSRAKRKGVVDKLAAQVILQSYIDAHEI